MVGGRAIVRAGGYLPGGPHRLENVVRDEVADLVAERLTGVLVIAEVLTRVDAAHRRLVGGLREALEAPHDARKAGIRQGEVRTIGAEEIMQGGGG